MLAFDTMIYSWNSPVSQAGVSRTPLRAARFYGAANEWPKIYNANTAAIGSDPNLIHPGSR